MRTARRVVLGMVLAVLLTLIPLPASARSQPKTLAAERVLGSVAGPSALVNPSFPIGYLGVSWNSGAEPLARFLTDGRWSQWSPVQLDDLPSTNGRLYSSLIPAHGADAYQLRGSTLGVRAVAINTTDGPRLWTLTWGALTAEAAHLAQPPVIARTAWGADESFRFNPDGSEKWPPAFYATQKLIVHHTAGQNDDPDPAATIRAIYYYHAITRGWGDIGYNFLVDAQGQVYKGRYSGPPGTWYEDTLTGEDALGLGVTGAHVSGYNSGTMGIAVLGTYTAVPIPAAARSALVDHLAWESEHHGLDPLATSTYTNPVNGTQKTNPNISGHLDWAATQCPGDLLYAELPAIRQDVAAWVSGSQPPRTASFAPLSVSVLKGQALGDPVANLAGDDGIYYRVSSVKEGKRQVLDWYGQGALDVNGVKKLTVTYDGSYTRTVKQTLHVFNFSTGAWQQISSESISTSDRTIEWSTVTPVPYISGTGEVLMTVVAKTGGTFTGNADLMRFTVEY